jgi:type IV secretion system protein VirB8
MKQEHEILSFPWIQALRVCRISIGVNIVQAFVIIGLIILIIFLFPLKEKEPVFVTFKDGSSNFVKITAVGQKARGEKQLIRYFLKEYVTARETVDKATEKDSADGHVKGRYTKVWYMSGSKVKEAFKSFYLNKETGLFFKKGRKRNIEIVSDSELGRGVHLIELTTVDTIDGKPGEIRQKWMVTLTYGFADQKISYEEGLLNPLGLFITEYSIRKKEIKE